MWAHILRDQLDVAADGFWACVRDGVAPDRASDDAVEEVDDVIRVEVVTLLVEWVGLIRREFIGMARGEAIARLNEYRSTGH